MSYHGIRYPSDTRLLSNVRGRNRSSTSFRNVRRSFNARTIQDARTSSDPLTGVTTSKNAITRPTSRNTQVTWRDNSRAQGGAPV